jgi:hypothetical protein
MGRSAQSAQPEALLFPRAILRAEFEGVRPFLETQVFKRERLAAQRP